MPELSAFSEVAVIVLNWNLPDDTLRCITSLKASDYPAIRILVVDNGSRPEVVEQLEAQLPADVLLVKNTDNLGFAGGNNVGFKHALALGSPYTLMLNNDTVVEPTMISKLVAAADANPTVGVLGPIIYYLDEPERVWFAGYRMPLGIYILRRGLHLKPPLQPVEIVDFISGCAMLIRRDVLKQIGGLSEDYFMYYEDLDYCFRAKAAGIQLGCVTDAKMWHAISSSTGGMHSPIKQYYNVKSSLLFYRRHSSGLRWFINVGLTLLRTSYSFVIALFQGRLTPQVMRMFLRGVREGWKPAPHVR